MPLSFIADTTLFRIVLIWLTVIPTYETHWIGRAYGFLDRHSVLIMITRMWVAAVRLCLYNPEVQYKVPNA